MPQGTVRKFDPATRTGSVLDDALRELPYDAEAIEGSGLMELRLGQRVRFEVGGTEDAPRATRLAIVSL